MTEDNDLNEWKIDVEIVTDHWGGIISLQTATPEIATQLLSVIMSHKYLQHWHKVVSDTQINLSYSPELKLEDTCNWLRQIMFAEAYTYEITAYNDPYED